MEASLERLGVALAQEGADAALRAQVDVEVTTAGFAAEVAWHVEGTQHQRILETADCWLLMRASAVVLAVAMDPVRVAYSLRFDQPEPPRIPELPPPPPPKLPGRAPVPAVQPRSPEPIEARSASGLEFGSRFAIGLGAFVLPRVGAGFAVSPFVGTSRIHARLSAQYWLPRSTSLVSEDSAGARFQLVSGGLRACPIVARARWRFPLCAGADVGAMIARGEGAALRTRQTAVLVWGAAVLQPGVELSLASRISLWLDLAGLVSINRPGVRVDRGGPLHQVGRLGVRASMGVSIHAARNM